MAPPDEAACTCPGRLRSKSPENLFCLSDGKLTVQGVSVLSEVPGNVSFTPFSEIPISSDAPAPLIQRAESGSYRGGFLGFDEEEPSHRLVNSLGRLTGREFVSIFRFKTWWSTLWVGKSGSELQMETQWVLLNLPEIGSYAVIVPIIEGSFRAALHP